MSVVGGRVEVIADLQEDRADQVPLPRAEAAAQPEAAALLLDP
jgi:hypothetical protein